MLVSGTPPGRIMFLVPFPGGCARKAALPPANFRGSSGAPIQKSNKTSRVFDLICKDLHNG